MEKQHLPTIINFFYVESFFVLVDRVQSFLLRSKSSVKLLSSLTIIRKDVSSSNSSSYDQLKLEKDDVNIEHKTIAHVMESLGLGCDQELSEHSRLKFDDLKTLFDDNEPCLAELKAAFCVFDQNNDGFIDENEMKRVMIALGLQDVLGSLGCLNMIRNYDVNGDGLIDFMEFVKVVEKSFVETNKIAK